MSLELHDVGQFFKSDQLLFRGITLTLLENHTYALVGPSGSGKSTLLGILAGQITPTHGTVNSEGVRRIGWVFQNPHGVPRRTALDHVVLPFLARGLSRADAEEMALNLLNDFRLFGSAPTQFRALSGGEAQRLMLARALAADPDVLLVDEPTAQLDLHTAATVNAVLQEASGRGCVVVIATHDPATKASCTDVIDLTAFQ